MEAFDPDKYLQQTKPFDPDEYLGKRKPFMGEGLLRGAINTLPTVGGLLGGFVGTGLGPAGTLGGAVLGAAGGKALENVAEGLLGDEKTRQEIYMDPVKEGALEAAGFGMSKVIGGGAKLAKQYIKEPIEEFASKIAAPVTENADDVIMAGERLGVKPTRGMLTGDRTVQNIESALSQRPSAPGVRQKEALEAVGGGVQQASEDLFKGRAGIVSPIEGGQKAKGLITEGVEQSIKPAKEIYQAVGDVTPMIEIGDKSVKRIANNIRNIPGGRIMGTPENSFAETVAKNLEATADLDNLRELKTYVGQVAGDFNQSPGMRNVAGEAYKKITKLEQNSIMRNAIEGAGESGRETAKGMIKSLKEANKIYGEASRGLKDLGEELGIGKVRNYQDFMRKVSDIPDEQLAEKFFKLKNFKAMEEFQKRFPQAFDIIKSQKLEQIYNKVQTGGQVSTKKMLNTLRGMAPEMSEMLFGKGATQKIKDIETISNVMYGKIGPSGTPEGMMFMDFKFYDPKTWLNTVHDQMVEKALKNPQMFEGHAQRFWARKQAEAFGQRGLGPAVKSVEEGIKFRQIPRALSDE